MLQSKCAYTVNASFIQVNVWVIFQNVLNILSTLIVQRLFRAIIAWFSK